MEWFQFLNKYYKTTNFSDYLNKIKCDSVQLLYEVVPRRKLVYSNVHISDTYIYEIADSSLQNFNRMDGTKRYTNSEWIVGRTRM